MRILGIDPGIAISRLCPARCGKRSKRLLNYGAITDPAELQLSRRLVQI